MSSTDSLIPEEVPSASSPKSDKVRDALRHLPLLGPLVDCRGSDHWETTREVSVTLVLATMPFWLGALVLFATEQTHLGYGQALSRTVWDGGLFMTATGLLAPIFWITAEDPRGARAFPSRLAHVLLTVLLSAVASLFFGLGIVNKNLREPFTFHLSLVLFIAASVLLYLSTVYHLRRLPDSSTVIRDSETEFIEDFERHRS